MKKLLMLSALMVLAISATYANGSSTKTGLMERLVMNQRVLTGFAKTNYSVVTHKMHAHAVVIEHSFFNDLRLNTKLITGFLNTTMYGTLTADYGSTGDYGESQTFDIDVDVDNSGMVHENIVLDIPSATWPAITLNNSQIHVSLSYGPPSYGGTTNTYQYVENYPGIFDGGTTLTCDYQAADLQSKQIDFDWGDGSGSFSSYQPARTVYIVY